MDNLVYNERGTVDYEKTIVVTLDKQMPLEKKSYNDIRINVKKVKGKKLPLGINNYSFDDFDFLREEKRKIKRKSNKENHEEIKGIIVFGQKNINKTSQIIKENFFNRIRNRFTKYADLVNRIYQIPYSKSMSFFKTPMKTQNLNPTSYRDGCHTRLKTLL